MNEVTAMNKEMKKVPTVRFKGFTDDWEQRKLGELVIIERGGSPRPIDAYITEAPDGLNWVKIGDAPEQGRYITHTKEKIKPSGLSKTRQVFPGDLILSNSMSFGKPYIMGITGCIHDGWLLIRNNQNVFDLKFLCQMLGTEQMLVQYRRLAAGSTVNNLNKELVANAIVKVPETTEQEQIGAFLENLDNVITLHQRKLDQLQTLKKYFLQNMFPAKGEKVPAIRFKGFMGDWEEHKFEDLFVVKSGYAFKAHDYVEKGVPIVNGESIKAGYISKDNLNFLPNIFISEYPDVILNNGDIVLGLNRPVIQGRLKISRIPLELDGSLLYQRAGKILFRKKVNHDFSYQLLSEEILKFAKREAVGSDQPFITTSKLNKWRFMVPEVEEQKKIGSYLNYLDNLITLKQRKLDQLQSLKKFMLQNLFI